MDRNTGLAEFLRSRRERLSPEQAGVTPQGSGSRRVPGLRREEVAALAGVSVDYYVRMERGHRLNVSHAVLDTLARALRLDATERAYLFAVAQPSQNRRRRTPPRPQRVRPGLYQVLTTLEHTPALVLGRRLDVLASNRMARALLTDFTTLPHKDQNMVRFLFCDQAARELYRHWDTVASEIVASLRLEAGRHPDDPQLTDLVGELCVHDEDFRRWWADHNVHQRTHGTKHFHHPLVGELSLQYESLTLPADPDQRLIIYTAEPDSPAHEALRLLDSWTRQTQQEKEASRATPRPRTTE